MKLSRRSFFLLPFVARAAAALPSKPDNRIWSLDIETTGEPTILVHDFGFRGLSDVTLLEGRISREAHPSLSRYISECNVIGC